MTLFESSVKGPTTMKSAGLFLGLKISCTICCTACERIEHKIKVGLEVHFL